MGRAQGYFMRDLFRGIERERERIWAFAVEHDITIEEAEEAAYLEEHVEEEEG